MTPKPRLYFLSADISRAALALFIPTPALLEAAPLTADLWFESTISTSTGQPLLLRAELNYDDTLSNAPVAVVMPGFSTTLGNLANVRAEAQRLRRAGFFAISVAMRGRATARRAFATRAALGQLHLRLPRLPNDLPRRGALPAHLAPFRLDPRNPAGSI